LDDGAVDVVEVTGVQGREDPMELLEALRLYGNPPGTSGKVPGCFGGVPLMVVERSSCWTLVELFQGCLIGVRIFAVPFAFASFELGDSD
jgi:hypothetical protein